MSPARSRRLALGLVVLAAGATFVGNTTQGRPFRLRLVLGALVVAVVLSILSEAAPRVALGLAFTMAVTAVTAAGPSTYNRLAELAA